MADINKISARVADISKNLTEVTTKINAMAASGDSVRKIFDAVNKTFEEQKKSTSTQLGQITRLTEATRELLKNGNLTSDKAKEYNRTLRKLTALEKELTSSRKQAQSALGEVLKDAARQQKISLENSQKQKSLDLEVKKSKEGVSDSVRALGEFERRLASEAEDNAKRKKAAEQNLRDEIKENNARRTQEVKEFNSRSKEFQNKRKARLKEIGKLEEAQARDRKAAAKTQLDIDLQILKKGKMTLEQRRDAQAKLIRGVRAGYSQQSDDYKKLTLRLVKLDQDYEKSAAQRDSKINKNRQDTAKAEETRQKRLSTASKNVFKAELDLSKKSASQKVKDVKKYYDSAQRNLEISGKKDSAEYKNLYAERLRLLKKYNKQAEAENTKASKVEGSVGTAPKTKTSFLGGVRQGFEGGAIGKAVGRLSGVGSVVAVLRKGFSLLSKAITGSFKAAVDFEAQLAQLQAVTGVTNKELADLEKSVLDVAGSTTFTSEQIVELQTELGKLGFSSEQIIAATKGIAATAQALGEQVGPVAQKVGQILNQYNLDASETEKISDTLVSTINSSALSFEGFGTALQYIGPLAAEVGTKFEETAAAMAVLADNGFTASRIGTGLRGILTELSSTGEDLTSVIKELANRNLSFSESIELVGKRNAAQLITLVDNIDALEQAEDKYYQAGSAAIASAQQIDTYKGNLQLLNSALNKVSISFGNLIKNSKILKLALKLVDEEGYNAALSSEQLAEANSSIYSKSLEESSKTLAQLAQNGEDITAKLRENAKKVLKESVIDPLIEEAISLKREQDRIKRELFGRGYTQSGFEVSELTRNEEYKNTLKRLKEINNILGVNNLKVENFSESYTEYSISMATVFDNLSESITSVVSQLKDLTEQERIDLLRAKVSAEYTKDLKERRKIRKEGFEDLKTASEFEFENRQKVSQINNVIESEKKKLKDLSGEELVLQTAVVNQLEQEKQNYTNLLYTKEELFQFAQKEYELEFKTLSNRIENEKQSLANNRKLLDIQIETIQNEIDSTNDKKKKDELIKKQIALQTRQLEMQENSYATISEYINEQYDELEKTRDLWKDLGYDTRILDKAFARLENIRLGVSDLAVDFPELAEKARELAASFKKQYGEALKDGKDLSEEQTAFVKSQIDTLLNDYGGLLSEEQKQALRDNLLSSLYPDPQDAEDDIKKKYLDLAKQIVDAISDAADAYNETALENTKNRLNAELEAIKNRYDTEEQILKSQLDNQLITESQFRAKQKELRQKQLADENDINKKIFDAEKKSELQNIAADTLAALASNAINNFEKYDAISAGLITTLGYATIIGAGVAKADAVNRKKFFPVKYEEGGMVSGPSHAQGGVPFTVQGQGGYEMEGGEFIVNKKASAMHRGLLEKINNSYKVPTSPSAYKFASGGMVNANANESVDYLKAIAEATTSTAISTSKPVRAFVSSKDLRANENERRLRDRNDKI
jgi:hypothetical protein